MVQLYQDQVYNTALGLLKNEEEAQDTAQEVFIEAFRSLGKFREESRISTWLYRIAINKSLDLIRKKKRKKRWTTVVSLFGGEDKDSASQVADFEHPGVKLENKERAKILFSAIEKLPENQRIAFTLHKIEDLSYKEIADTMQTSLSSIEALIHRAKKNLRKELGGWYEKNKE